MAYDGIFAGVTARKLDALLKGARIEKVQQPEPEEILMQVHTSEGRKKLLISASPRSCGVWMTEQAYENPQQAPNFCMFLRKHVQGGRISAVTQVEAERILYFDIETVNEMGYAVNCRLIAETMGKHSNIILTDLQSGKILESIKHISIDVNRYRQILPGLPYINPPSQGKADFWTVTEDEILQRMKIATGEAPAKRTENVAAESTGNDPAKSPAESTAESTRNDTAASLWSTSEKPRGNTAAGPSAVIRPMDKILMQCVQGLGPAAAAALCEGVRPADIPGAVLRLREKLLAGEIHPAVYSSEAGVPEEVHIFPLTNIAEGSVVTDFADPGQALDFYYSNRRESNRVIQKGETLTHSVSALLDKQLLKKQRLLEDIKKAENADLYRLKGELLTANLHLAKPGDKQIKVISYYDGTELTIELDEKKSAAKNAQNYYKKYGKAKTAKKEKLIQLNETNEEITYLESVLAMIPLTASYEELDLIRTELIKLGYLRGRKAGDRKAAMKPKPRVFDVCGYQLLVGRNNTENDYLTFKLGGKTDLWFHTKDIPGSHCVLLTRGDEMGADEIYRAAAIAAWFSKGQSSENVPVDYVPLRYVHKPGGAKPGMVVFTNNRTVWVNPGM